MTSKEPGRLMLYVAANMPMVVLFGLVGFIYTTYLSTYVVELISNDYDYNTHDTSKNTVNPTFLITIHQISEYGSSFAEFLSSSHATAYTPMQRKGIVYAILLHLLLLAFLISTIRVIKTNPGKVPLEWHKETEKELTEVVNVEKKILLNIRRQVQIRKMKEEEERRRFEERKQLEEAQAQTEAEAEVGIAIETIGDIPADEGKVGLLEQKEPVPLERSLVEDEDIGNQAHQGHGGATFRDPNDESEKLSPEPDPLDLDFGMVLGDEEAERRANEKIQQLAVMSALKRSNKRFCSHCQMFKPERAHHCRQCGYCVLKMDHHCPWVGNCVGFYNYKYFINMVFYADLLLLMTAVTYSELVKDSVFNPTVSTFKLYIILLCYLLTWLLGLILLLFFGFHIWLISIGKSTLEFCEKKQLSKYNFGIYGNLKRTLGTNIIYWFVPIYPYVEGGGLVYK